MKKVFACLLAVCMVLPAMAGCSRPQETTAVRLSEVTHSVFYAPQYVAISQGFFADEGLTVELSNGGGADKVMTAVVSGQADIGLAGPEASIYVAQQGKEDPPVIFAQLTRRDGSFLVGRSDGPFRWENLRGSTIIGGRAGGVPEMTLEYVLRQHGLTPGEDVTVDTSVQFNMMAGAFTGGGGDYVTLFEPTATEVEQAGKGYILCSIGQESGEIPYTAYFANRSYLTANAGTVQRFTNAIARAQRWVAEHTDREVAEAICGQFPDTDLAVLERVCARHREIDAWNLTPVMEQAALERLGVQCLFPREQFQMFCPVTAEKQAALAAATTCSWVASGQPNLMLFSTVSWNRYTVWNTMEMFLSKLSQVNSRTSCPPTETEPAFTS